MFSALNSFISRLDADSTSQASNQSAGESTSYGFQILRNTNSDLPLEPWFDFIIGINGHYIEQPDPLLFATEIRNCAGGLCSLDLWSAKGQRTHALTVPIPQSPGNLGLSIQLSPLNATQNIWHILSVPSPLSPAHIAGLLPYSDYILGSPSGTLRGESALSELIEDHLNRSLVLWVYNSEFDVVREVELVPRRGWGGEGALGAVLGYGALHRLPIGLGEEVQAPGEKLFDAEGGKGHIDSSVDQTHFISVAPTEFSHTPMMSPKISAPPLVNPSTPSTVGLLPQAVGRSKKARAGTKSPNRAFEDMFSEGAKKSAEQDFVPSRKGTPSAPPPKIAGGPTKESTMEDEKAETEDVGEPGEAETT